MALGVLTLAACGGGTTGGGQGPSTSSQKLYVTVYGTDSVAVIDEQTHATVDSIPVGAGKGPAILLKTPDAKKLYTANWKDNSVSVIDPATNAVKTIPLGSRPWVIAMSPTGDVVYAGLNANKIAVISTADDTVSRSIDMGGLLPESVIVSPDGATLYVAVVDQSNITNLLGGTMEAVSASTGAVVHPALSVGGAPAWISIAPDGSHLYTLNFISNDISVIDTASWTVSSTIPLGSGAQPIIGAVEKDGTLVVTNFGTASVDFIDPAAGKINHTFKTSGRPVGVELSADGKRGYVTDFAGNSLSIAPNPLTLQSGDLGPAIGTGPGEVVAFDPATGATVGDPIAIDGAGPTSVVAE
jgi:YVTN family beta-propeller protein